MNRMLLAYLAGAIALVAQTQDPQVERWNKIFASGRSLCQEAECVPAQFPAEHTSQHRAGGRHGAGAQHDCPCETRLESDRGEGFDCLGLGPRKAGRGHEASMEFRRTFSPSSADCTGWTRSSFVSVMPPDLNLSLWQPIQY